MKCPGNNYKDCEKFDKLEKSGLTNDEIFSMWMKKQIGDGEYCNNTIAEAFFLKHLKDSENETARGYLNRIQDEIITAKRRIKDSVANRQQEFKRQGRGSIAEAARPEVGKRTPEEEKQFIRDDLEANSYIQKKAPRVIAIKNKKITIPVEYWIIKTAASVKKYIDTQISNGRYHITDSHSFMTSKLKSKTGKPLLDSLNMLSSRNKK